MSTFSTVCLSHDTYLVTIASFYNSWLVTMDTILIYHVTDVYQIHVIVSMVSVQICLDVNMDCSLGNRSVI
jgi:hypothetical protein